MTATLHPPHSDRTARIAHALRRTPEVSGCGISWYVEEGCLVLRGRVRSFYQKQIAQTVALQLSSFERVVNELEVTTAHPTSLPLTSDL
jgi:osmotically-inducible protein OsmY